MSQIFGKLGLTIGIFFSISPFPTLFTAFTKDSNAIKSIPESGIIWGLACCMLIGSFCSIHGFVECIISCIFGIISTTCCFASICYFKNNFMPLLKTYSILLGLSYCIVNVFPEKLTDFVILVINTFSCVAGPFETSENLLKTKD